MDDKEARTAVLMPLMGIRFIAVMGTVIHHTAAGWLSAQPWVPLWLSNMVSHFNMGLGFFFILSGFILQTLYRGRLDGKGTWPRYFVSRLARIYPLFLFGLLISAPFVGTIHWNALPQILLLQSWPNDGNGLGWENWNTPAWMLSVELFFYLCFPLICRVVQRAPHYVLLFCIVAAAIFAFSTGSVDPPVGPPRFHWMTYVPVPFLRLPEFLAGTIIAELQARRGVRKIPVPPELSLLVFGVVLTLSGFAAQAAVAVVLATIVILGLVNSPRAPFTRLMNTRAFMILGASSYALYIIHEPVNFALRTVATRWWMLLQYPIGIALAVLLLFWFEAPTRRWINARFSPPPPAKEPDGAGEPAVSPAAAAAF